MVTGKRQESVKREPEENKPIMKRYSEYEHCNNCCKWGPPVETFNAMINSDDHRENGDDLQIQDVVSTYRIETKRIEV